MNQTSWELHCPVAVNNDSPRVMLAHGEGGRMMRKLIRETIVDILSSESLAEMDDAARLPAIDGPLAMTTDSFVVSPLFFPGGDIGSLCVYGTVNDLAVSGAKPLYLTLSLILEEGLPIAVLQEVLQSVARAANQTGIKIVAGDTKVVPRGAADGLFINTTGIGELVDPVPPGPQALCEGDELIVTGPVGRHGIAVLCAREELALQPAPTSDCGSLVAATMQLRHRLGTRLRTMRDATRGGVGAVLHEWSESSGLTLAVNEKDIPVSPDVRGASELLGLDPIHIANEGTMLIAVESGASEDALEALRSLPETQYSAKIGTAITRQATPVTITRMFGRPQPLDQPQGAPQPRIC
ncbi:Hydrogenase isoenzymes formation protein HypE [Rubripirellula amarantea]|uniref:Hydrogenase isoenzymes formation protein HypE n=1 Tax=Rubripirellula amarantea TaxID=2527999 RepID=A0A5C5WD92_9BACT|nr:hydrogenase expression/formation protein HypE [Rubripirellula amarantea]TWT48055.1 Hydrogenase isoenzymes formation protein HypE [Rubripirellula amarantea]